MCIFPVSLWVWGLTVSVFLKKEEGMVRIIFQQPEVFTGRGSWWGSLSPQSWLSLGVFFCNVLPQSPSFSLLPRQSLRATRCPPSAPLPRRGCLCGSDYVGVPAPRPSYTGGHRLVATRQLLLRLKPALAKAGPDTS